MLTRRHGCLVLFVVSAVSGLAAACLGAPPSAKEAAGDEIAARWTFDAPGDADAWRPGQHCERLGAKDGALQIKLTGPDAFIFSPPVRVRLDACVVRVRMRSERGGTTEVYWTTDKDGEFSQRQVAQQYTPASSQFKTYEFVLGATTDVDRHLTAFRIDPYNGNRDGLVEIDSVEVVKPAPVFDVQFSATDARAGGVEATLRLRARQSAGRAVEGEVLLGIGDDAPQSHRIAKAGDEVLHEAKVRADGPGFHRFLASAKVPGGLPFSMEAGVSRLAGEPSPEGAGLRTDQLRLELVPDVGGADRYGAARLWLAGDDGAWIDAGLLQPLATIMFQDGDTIVSRCPPLKAVRLGEDTVTLSGAVRVDGGKWVVGVDVAVVREGGKDVLRVRASLVGETPGRLYKFAGPTLLAGRGRRDMLDRYGLFGGLEFLEPGWASSSDRAVGEKFARRWTPHPHKITLPVMAIEQSGVTAAMMWQPTKHWSRERDRPAATFASPNFLDGQPNHRMELSAPSVPDWLSENESCARRAYELRKDELLRLEYVVVAERNTPVAWMARRWYELFGTPAPPPTPHDAARTYELCIQNYGETMYWPDQKGWRHHMYLAEPSRFNPYMAGELISHAARGGDEKWVKQTGLAGRSIIETLGPIANRLGRPADVQALIASQRADGTWPFKNTPKMIEQAKEFTHGKYADLGTDGSTCVGTTVMSALPILRHALLTGDPECVKAAVKALDAMKRFRVPRGAQVWEVHQLIPDIRGAALAVEAYRLGYDLTGEAKYLDEAQYWAWTGVPFLYAWHVPIEPPNGQPANVFVSRGKTDWSDRAGLPGAEAFEEPNRQITPYATIPVFGTTFYVMSWFGTVVQWCGLEWAYQTLDLLERRPDPLLKSIADGVLISGRQQMLDRRPWVGLFPDVWDLSTNTATGAFICSSLIHQCLRAQGNAPADTQVWTQVLHETKPPRHVSGWGRLRRLESADGQLAVEVGFAPGQVNELVVVGAEKPGRVSVGEIELPQGPGDDHWQYQPEQRAIIVRFKQPQPVSAVAIRW